MISRSSVSVLLAVKLEGSLRGNEELVIQKYEESQEGKGKSTDLREGSTRAGKDSVRSGRESVGSIVLTHLSTDWDTSRKSFHQIV